MDTRAHSDPTVRLEQVFQPGTTLIYPLHGKCTLLAVEEKQIGGRAVPFYKLEIQRSSFSRSSRREPAIWVPVESAKERGLRAPIGPTDIDPIFKVLSDREYYFNIDEPWGAISLKIENAIRAEAAIGLAKALSCLYVLKKKQVVATSETNRAFESAHKALVREISDATGESIRDIEVKIAKALRNKTLLSH